MKIAQIAPVYESVPPTHYGGTERVVYYLTEELVRRGHDVTLFASGDSTSSARLVPTLSRSTRADPSIRNSYPYQIMMFEKVLQQAHEFDVLHFHTELLHFPMLQELRSRSVTTLHYRLDEPDLIRFFHAFPDMHLITVSEHQRSFLGGRGRVTSIPHGLPADLLRFEPEPSRDYLLFLGRTSPDKGLDRAIEIARQTRLPLKIAAKIDPADEQYWQDVIEPMCRASDEVEFLGEVDDRQKEALLGHCLALLFPIRWPEPFGLVMIEAMACGAPVVGWRHGAVPEVIKDGVTGTVVDSIEQAVAAVPGVVSLDRRRIRAEFERRFTAQTMTEAHERLYETLLQRGDRQPDQDDPRGQAPGPALKMK